MDYPTAISYILQRSGYDRGFVGNPFDAEIVGLRRTEWLLSALDHPERCFSAVHVAGTNGKGSTSACLAAILLTAGYRVGVYTSPHLHTFRERIQINGRPIPEATFAALTAEVAPLTRRLVLEHPGWGEATAFELATVLAFLAFARAGLQVVVVEVGLGGRLDATNVLLPEVSVITPISYDHTGVLGETLAEIAAEKGGIIKAGRPVVCARQPTEARVVLERMAAERGSPLFLGSRDWQPSGTPANFDLAGPWGHYRDLRLSLLGQHQVENAATAVAASWALGEHGLPVSEASVRAGLASVRWPGRLEVARERPLVVIDAAHNVDSARNLATALHELFHWRRLTLILGIGGDKDVAGIVQTLAPLADHLIATASHHPRAALAGRIAALARESRPSLTVDEAPSAGEALCRALAEAADHDLVCAAGSLYMAADAREALGLAAPVAFERDLLHR